MDAVDVTKILEKHTEKLGGLIAILEDIQASYGFRK